MKSEKKASKKDAKRNLKLRDLKPTKDAKGGEITFTYGSIKPTYTSQS